ncbi:MAG: hypothetical protein ABIN36_14625 [Ferruginibacter sp.]
MQSKLYLFSLLLFFSVKEINAQYKLFTQDGILIAGPENVITRGTKLKLDRAVLSNLYKTKPADLRIAIPIEGELVVVTLKKKNLFAKNFEVILSGTLEKYDYTPGYYLQGKIEGETNSFAAISIFEDFAATGVHIYTFPFPIPALCKVC